MTKNKWIGGIVAGVAIVSGLATIKSVWWPTKSSPPPQTSVKASGENAIAAGNDVRIGERTTVDKHDFGQDQREQAETYLGIARTICKNLSERIAATSA